MTKGDWEALLMASIWLLLAALLFIAAGCTTTIVAGPQDWECDATVYVGSGQVPDSVTFRNCR